MKTKPVRLITLLRLAIVAIGFAVPGAFASDFASPLQPAAAHGGGGLGQNHPIPGVTEVALDPALLAQLPESGPFTLLGFPIGNGQTVDLELERFHVELAGAHAEVSSVNSKNQIVTQSVFNLGDVVQFRGGIIGDEGSKAFLSFSSTANAGILVGSDGATWIMSDGEVDHRGPIVITSMTELPPNIINWKPFSCGTDTNVIPQDGDIDDTQEGSIMNAIAGCKVVTVYVETDFQLYGKLGSNSTALTNYILQMAGAANIIYYKDLKVDLRLAGWFIYTSDAADGFGTYTNDGSSALNAVRSKWQSSPYTGYSRNLVSYLTSQNTGGGVAWVGQICSTSFDYSMCGNLDGAFPYPLSLRNSQNWDIMVFCHEMGHNFSAPHTHDQGLDNCYTGSGLGSCVAPDGNYPPIGGTIMSYCHLCPSGMTNINLIFHFGQTGSMISYVAGRPCVGGCGSMTISATQNQTDQVSLSWTSDPSAISYTVFRRLPDTTSPKDLNLPVAIGTVVGTTKVDASMVCGKNYEYYVRANYTTSPTGSATGMMSDIAIGAAICSNDIDNLMGWGINTFSERTVPVGLVGKQIAAGYNHSIVLKKNGSVQCWGNNANGQTAAQPGIAGALQVAAGYRHSAALLADGTVQCWGAGTTSGSSPNYGQSIVPAGLTGVTQIAAGGFHTLARKSDGTMVCWGSNLQGQCTIPVGLPPVAQVAAGYFHTLALLTDGTVRAWGYNFNGQTTVPVGLDHVVKIAAGAYHSIALKDDGSIVCWGAGTTNTGSSNNYGQSIVPSDLTEVAEISGGGKHTVVRQTNGLIRSWGYNSSGQCNSPAGYRAESISAGFEFTIGMFNQNDEDGDGVIGYLDNCPLTANADQTDCDGDGFGDVCAIAMGEVDDMDSNGVPDWCQYAYGDLDLSGEVDGGDIGLCLLDFGPCPGCPADLDGSGEVDGGDIGLILLNFGDVP
ncbi:MAG: hypothetical protein K8R92_06595 [Planctomycetes bacterium]|nr:hypothetical protein [Planctomycetota bacterium]